MNPQVRGIKLSLVIHSVVFLTIALLSIYAGQAKKRVVIDFSLIKGSPGTVRTVKKTVVARKPVKKKAVVKPKPKPRPKELPSQVPVLEKVEKEKEPEAPVPEPVVEETVQPVDDPRQLAEIEEAPSLEGAASGPGIPGRDFIYIRELVQGNISYPRIARRMGLQGRVTIAFVILTDGTVKDIDIVESSGSPILDRNAVDAVKKTSPFPHHHLEAKVIIPIQYTLQ
jgi:protein TonB